MRSIVFVLPKLGIGGVERSLISLLKQMPNNEFESTVLTFLPGGELETYIPENITVRTAKNVGYQESIRAAVSCTLRKLRLVSLFSIAKKLYHKFGFITVNNDAPKEHFDIAVAYSDGLATWYTSEKITANTKYAFVHTDVKQAGYDVGYERQVYAGYDKIYFGSKSSQKSFLTLLPELKDRTSLVPNGIDVDEILRLSNFENPYPKDESTCKLLTVGRLSHEKGVDKIPKLLRMLKDTQIYVHWYVVGDGPERDNLLKQAKELDVAESLFWVGKQENPYIYMRGCDVYVQPSNYEGYCIALAEARVLNIPCVACDFSGASEQIKDGADGLVTGMSVEEMFPAIAELICNKTRREEFSNALKEINDSNCKNEHLRNWWNNL